MTEDAPLEPVAPEPELPTQPAPQADPTQPVPAATTASSAGQPTWPSPTAAPPPPPKRPSTVAVPIWLVFVVGALLFGLIGFGIGWIAAPGDDHSTTIVRPGGLPNTPNGGFRIPGNGSNNGNGSSGNGSNGNDTPTIPTPALRGAFLGVATEASTDPNGVKVLRVVADSPASDAGLKADDVITKVDDDAVANPQQLATRISAHQRGDKVTITYVRDGDTHTADVTLASRSSIIPSTPSTTAPGD